MHRGSTGTTSGGEIVAINLPRRFFFILFRMKGLVTHDEGDILPYKMLPMMSAPAPMARGKGGKGMEGLGRRSSEREAMVVGIS